MTLQSLHPVHAACSGPHQSTNLRPLEARQWKRKRQLCKGNGHLARCWPAPPLDSIIVRLCTTDQDQGCLLFDIKKMVDMSCAPAFCGAGDLLDCKIGSPWMS